MKCALSLVVAAILCGVGAFLPAQELPPPQEAPSAAIANESEESPEGPPRETLPLNLEYMDLKAPSSLAPSELMSVANEREFRMALWNAPLGRVYLETARDQMMLGREGLIGGGHMLGIGLGTMALGDGTLSPLNLGFDRHRWAEMNLKERIWTGFQVSVALGVLGALVEAID